MIAVVVVALIAFAVTAFAAPGFLLSDDDGGDKASDGGNDNGGGGGGDSDLGDPADTVEAFFEAALAGDCDAAEALVTDELLEDEGGCDEEDFQQGDLDGVEFEAGEAEIDGDEATVPVTFRVTDSGSSEPFEETSDYLLVVEDDQWKISNFGDESSSDSGGGSADAPSAVPSDFPTDLPTDFPTDLPTDFPTEFPTDFPTEFPTEFLTDFPTEFPTE